MLVDKFAETKWIAVTVVCESRPLHLEMFRADKVIRTDKDVAFCRLDANGDEEVVAQFERGQFVGWQVDE